MRLLLVEYRSYRIILNFPSFPSIPIILSIPNIPIIPNFPRFLIILNFLIIPIIRSILIIQSFLLALPLLWRGLGEVLLFYFNLLISNELYSSLQVLKMLFVYA
jgi:hypothetical protein